MNAMTTTHTPGPRIGIDTDEDGRRFTQDCGCYVDTVERLVYCPTHAQAPAMLALLKRYMATMGKPKQGDDLAECDLTARAILRAVEGTP